MPKVASACFLEQVEKMSAVSRICFSLAQKNGRRSSDFRRMAWVAPSMVGEPFRSAQKGWENLSWVVFSDGREPTATRQSGLNLLSSF